MNDTLRVLYLGQALSGGKTADVLLPLDGIPGSGAPDEWLWSPKAKLFTFDAKTRRRIEVGTVYDVPAEDNGNSILLTFTRAPNDVQLPTPLRQQVRLTALANRPVTLKPLTDDLRAALAPVKRAIMRVHGAQRAKLLADIVYYLTGGAA